MDSESGSDTAQEDAPQEVGECLMYITEEGDTETCVEVGRRCLDEGRRVVIYGEGVNVMKCIEVAAKVRGPCSSSQMEVMTTFPGRATIEIIITKERPPRSCEQPPAVEAEAPKRSRSDSQ